MTDTRTEFSDYFVSSNPLENLVGYEREVALESWQACKSLNDKRIQQLLAVIAKQKEVLTIVNDTVTHGAGAFIKDSLLHTNIEEALALTADDVELVEVAEMRNGEWVSGYFARDLTAKLYKIHMKGK